MLKRIFLSPDAPEGGAPQTAEQINRPQTGQVETVQDETPEPALRTAPPAATIVVTAEKSEREVELEAELEAERVARRKAETDAAHLQDENHRIKQVTRPEPARTKSKNEGWGFFGRED